MCLWPSLHNPSTQPWVPLQHHLNPCWGRHSPCCGPPWTAGRSLTRCVLSPSAQGLTPPRLPGPQPASTHCPSCLAHTAPPQSPAAPPQCHPHHNHQLLKDSDSELLWDVSPGPQAVPAHQGMSEEGTPGIMRAKEGEREINWKGRGFRPLMTPLTCLATGPGENTGLWLSGRAHAFRLSQALGLPKPFLRLIWSSDSPWEVTSSDPHFTKRGAVAREGERLGRPAISFGAQSQRAPLSNGTPPVSRGQPCEALVVRPGGPRRPGGGLSASRRSGARIPARCPAPP